ncbi:MAG: cupin domain-containing protein [Gammaproteobacteria bacterium]|nr:cupin domain-containing protein [Gammaproteobacteria bacterium]
MTDPTQTLILPDIFQLAAQPERLAWQPFRAGIEIFPIYKSSQGCSAALLRYAPGSRVPAHAHVGYEHILVLSGEQNDERHQYPQGAFVVSPPGTSHTVESPAGCIVLAIWEKPVSFL